MNESGHNGCVNSNIQQISVDPGYDWNAGHQSREVYYGILSAIFSDQPLLIIGPTGQGKTQAVRQIAYDLSSDTADETKPVVHTRPVPISIYQCSKSSDQADMVWQWMVNENGIPYLQLGALSAAIEEANRIHLLVLLIDEINTLKGEVQKALNPLVDNNNGKRRVSVGDKSWTLNEDSRIAIFATMNPVAAGYGGIRELNVDLADRFPHKIELSYPDPDEEAQVLGNITADQDLVRKLIMLAQHTRGTGEEQSTMFTRPLSTRDLHNFIVACQRDGQLFNDQKFLLKFEIRTGILGNYASGPEKDALAKKIKDIFNV